MAQRKITFNIPAELWEQLSIKAIKEKKTKTEILLNLIKDFLKK